MPKVDFYSIAKPDIKDQHFFVCRLVDKIHAQGLAVYIHTDSEQVAQQIDDLLWCYRPESFIPHDIYPSKESEQHTVLIGYSDEYTGGKEVLININSAIPDFHHEFQRILEIVPNDDVIKKISRQHWQFYKNQGYALQYNK